MARKKAIKKEPETQEEVMQKPKLPKKQYTVLVDYDFGKGVIPPNGKVMLTQKAYEFYKFKNIVR